MLQSKKLFGAIRWRMPMRGALSAAVAAAVLLLTPLAHAQQPAQPAQPAKPKAAQPAKPKPAEAKKKPQNTWVKLCQDQQSVNAGIVTKTKICLSHHERLSAANGRVLVSVAVRNVQRQEKETLMVLVPLGVALAPGLQVIVDDNKPVPLRFTFCHIGGCSAEAEATKEVVANLKKGTQLKVLAINNTGKTIAFPVPLTGFTKAYEGGPIDSKKYHEARQKLMVLIKKRHAELAKKAQAAAAKKKQENKDAKAKAPAPAAPKKPQ